MDQLRLVLCPTKNVPKKDQQLSQHIFNTWYELWVEDIQDRTITPAAMYADAFVKADFAICLFMGERCIGVTLLRWVNTADPGALKDSYFKSWEPYLPELKKYKTVEMGSHFVLDKTVRGLKLPVSLKEVMIYVCVKTFVNSPADGFLATLRVDRNMHTAMYRWGSKALTESSPSPFGDMMALTICEKQDFQRQCEENPKTAELDILWNARQVVMPEDVSFQFLVDPKVIPFRKNKKVA